MLAKNDRGAFIVNLKRRSAISNKIKLLKTYADSGRTFEHYSFIAEGKNYWRSKLNLKA